MHDTLQKPLRLGFAVKVMAQPGLKSNDSRRWQNEPHLRQSILYMTDIFRHLEKNGINMYRMSSDLAPYVTHPDLPQFHNQIREAADELRTLGTEAKRLGLRLSFHPSQFVVLNSPDPGLVEKSVADLVAQAEMLDRMELGPEAVLVIHTGGAYNDKAQGRARWIKTFGRLPDAVRRRLVLENDDVRYSAADVLLIHEHTGVPLIFDYQHFWCNNLEGLDLRPTLEAFIRTWPAGVRPKIHYSSPRTEMRLLKRRNKATGKQEEVQAPPIWTGHADYLNPFEFISFMRMATGLCFDVMLEAKLKDLAVLRIKKDLLRYGTDIAPRFGLETLTLDEQDGDEWAVEAEDEV
ncbi:MAG: UV DNA damage repair endonuclease UvsE [Herpetosiphon sp.]